LGLLTNPIGLRLSDAVAGIGLLLGPGDESLATGLGAGHQIKSTFNLIGRNQGTGPGIGEKNTHAQSVEPLLNPWKQFGCQTDLAFQQQRVDRAFAGPFAQGSLNDLGKYGLGTVCHLGKIGDLGGINTPLHSNLNLNQIVITRYK
jgi:hypothetical protein